MLGNLASFGWSTLAAAWTLEALGYGSPAQLGSPSSYVAVAIAGLVLILVNYFYITVISESVGNGTSLWFLTKREFIPVVPVNVVLITMSAVTAFLYTEVGLAGLLPLASDRLHPAPARAPVLRDIPIWDLSVDEADRTLRGRPGRCVGPELGPAPGAGRRRHASGRRACLTRLDDFGAVMQLCSTRLIALTGGGRLGLLSGNRIRSRAACWRSRTLRPRRRAGGPRPMPRGASS